MWYLQLYSFKQKYLLDCKLPYKPLNWFDEHRINPQLNTIVKLVKRKELDVLVDDDAGPIEVDAVAIVLASQARFFRCEQNPITMYPERCHNSCFDFKSFKSFRLHCFILYCFEAVSGHLPFKK
jgi:hypothetical protein